MLSMTGGNKKIYLSVCIIHFKTNKWYLRFMLYHIVIYILGHFRLFSYPNCSGGFNVWNYILTNDSALYKKINNYFNNYYSNSHFETQINA